MNKLIFPAIIFISLITWFIMKFVNKRTDPAKDNCSTAGDKCMDPTQCTACTGNNKCMDPTVASCPNVGDTCQPKCPTQGGPFDPTKYYTIAVPLAAGGSQLNAQGGELANAMVVLNVPLTPVTGNQKWKIVNNQIISGWDDTLGIDGNVTPLVSYHPAAITMINIAKDVYTIHNGPYSLEPDYTQAGVPKVKWDNPTGAMQWVIKEVGSSSPGWMQYL